MIRRGIALIALLSLSLFWSACDSSDQSNGRGGGGGGNPSATGNFLLVADSTNSKLLALSINTDGSLSPSTSNFIATDAQPNAILVNGKNIYVTAGGSTNVDAFTMTTGATFSRIGFGAFSAGLNPIGVVIAPNGQMVVANAGSSSLSLESIDASGTLTQINSTGLSSAPRSITVAAGFVWVATSTGIAGFQVVNNTINPVAFGTFSISTVSWLVGNGNFLYAADSTNNVVRVFSVNPTTGLLTQSGTTYPVDTEPVQMTFDSSGNFLYVVNRSSATITVFSVNTTTGALTRVGTSTNTNGTNPTAIVFDSLDTKVYVANSTSGTIQAYSVNTTTGVLTAIGAPVSVGGQPAALAIIKP